MSLLEVRDLSCHFGSLVAVNRVSFAVKAGELRAVIGPNGAGKTTFFNLISGLLPPSGGSIRLDGKDITDLPAHRRVEMGITRTFQVTEIFPELTVRDNLLIPVEVAAGLRLHSWLSRRRRKEIADRVDELLEMGGLAGLAGRLAGELSHGDQRATEIMMALALRPRLLLLDEPTAGMGDQETRDVVRLVRRLHRNDRLAIVLIEHDMRVVFHLADRIMVLAEGVVLAEGTPHEIAGDERRPVGLPRFRGMTTLRVESLHTYYGKSHILHDVRLEVREGEIVALLGRNGAGKTTTLRSVVGLTPARSGSVHIFDAVTTDWPPYRIAALGVGYVPEGRRVFPNLTVEENLLVPLERPGPWTMARVYGLFPRLQERRLNQRRPALWGRAGDAGDRSGIAPEPEAAVARRAVAGSRASDRARHVRCRRVDAKRGDRGPPCRTECPRRRRDRRSRLCARRRPCRSRGAGRGIRRR